MDLRSFLQDQSAQLEISLSCSQVDQLLDYVELIKTWNKAYNLVGTSNAKELIQKHVLDSLAIASFVVQGPVIDVGSGAGLPGIPLAIALPDISFTLLDSNGKKARFMRQVVMQLKLDNVKIVQSRVEQHQANPAASTVIARAFAPTEKALELLTGVCAQHAVIQLMLGVKPANLPQVTGIQRMQVYTINVPGLNSQRHLLIANTDL